MAKTTVDSLKKKRTGVVGQRIKTAALAVKPAVTKAAKKLKTAATKELRHLVVEQKVITHQIEHREAFDKQAKANATPADRKRKAKAPGRRVSKSGKVYYENRTNRADSSRTSRI